MIYIWLNALPIFAATLAGMAVSWLYHRLFGRASGGRITPGYLLTVLVAQGWFAAILAGALILAPKEAGVWVMAMGSAIVIWIGFIVPAVVATEHYRGLPLRSVVLDSLCWLAIMLAQVVVLQALGLTPPPTG